MADGRWRSRGSLPVESVKRKDAAEAWWYLSEDEKRRWHETHRWPARMAGVLRRPEEGGFDCAFEVSAASSDLPGASDCALAPADATNAQDKRHFKERHRSLKRGGLRATFRTAADRAAHGQARFGGCGQDQVLQGAAGAADEAPPPEEPEESEAFLKDVAAAMAELITGVAGGSKAALAAAWTGRCDLRGAAPWLAIAAGGLGWKDFPSKARVCLRKTGLCSCRRCRAYCVACKCKLPDNPVPDSAQGFLHLPGDQIAIWARFERYCIVCFEHRLQEWAVFEDRVELS